MDQNSPFKKNIKKIVYVMFENRSFDNLLGWLYDGQANPTDVTINNIPPNPEIQFHGLTSGLLEKFAQPLVKDGNPFDSKSYPIVRGVQGDWLPCSTPIADPHEKFEFVTRQLYSADHASGIPSMKGFLQDYYDKHPRGGIQHQILQTYDFQQAQVINTLARSFGVSDEWFCSIPSQTSINRAYSLAGDSVGYKSADDAPPNKPFLTAMVNNSEWSAKHGKIPSPFTGKTIWNVLSENGRNTDADWKIYYSDKYQNGWFGQKVSYTYLMFDQLQKLLNPPGEHGVDDPRYQEIDQFFVDAKAGNLPDFSYLEPKYTWEEDAYAGIHGNDYHPPSDICKAEAFLTEIYKAVLESPHWGETLLIVAFDEHGGTFDHIPPPANLPNHDKPIVNPGGADKNEDDFNFDRLGVRVPMLFISAWVKPHTVIRSDQAVPFDHTSWLATLLKWYGLDPALLGKRTAVAPTFENVISDEKRGHAELPAVGGTIAQSQETDGTVTVDLVELLSRNLVAANPDLDRAEVLRDMLSTCSSQTELRAYVKDVIGKVEN